MKRGPRYAECQAFIGQGNVRYYNIDDMYWQLMNAASEPVHLDIRTL